MSTERVRKMFNERLKEIRKLSGITQKEVAAAINYAERAYRALEAGRCKPSFDTLIALADCFNVSIDYLVGRTKSNENRITIKDYYELIDELIATDTLIEQGLSSPPQYIVISRFDDVGNIVMLSAIEKKKGKYSFGGYVPFFESSSKQLQVNFDELFEFFEYVQKNNINIIFDGQFFQDNG